MLYGTSASEPRRSMAEDGPALLSSGISLTWMMGVSRSKLSTRAIQTGFDPGILTVAFNVYQTQMVVTLQSVAQEAGHPRRGMPAGCAFAAYEVQM